jgi:lipid-binding SYLF domain-containing protein
LKKAQGFAIFSVARLGFLVTARAGSGVVIARLQDDSWSAPAALGLGGLGGGFNAGADVTDCLIILNNKAAVRSFMATGSLQVGGNLSVAVGPLGRAAEASGAINSSGNLAAMYSYSKSKGLYGGVSIEGTVLVERSDANSKAYHRTINAKQILSGNIEPPTFAQPLINTIEKFTMSGNVAMQVEEGKRSIDHGWGSDDENMSRLDRQMANARMSPDSSPTSRRNNKDYDDDEYINSSHRPGAYAFGGSGSVQTNSPNRIKKSFISGNSYMSSSKGTDYTDSNTDGYTPPSSRNSKGRPTFGGRKSSAASGSIFGDDAAALTPSLERGSLFESTNGSGIRTAHPSRTASFPTRFGKADDDTDDEPVEEPSNKDANGFDIVPRDSYEEANDIRGKPHRFLTRSGTNDMLDFELDRSAVTQRQAPRSNEVDLIDFGAPRRTGSGYDELDQELLDRSSSSYRGNDIPSRPKMQGRTSSTQKIMNRIRGNSQSTKNNAFANLDTWEPSSSSSRRRSQTPPDISPSQRKSSTPTGFRGATPPTSFKSTTPTGYKSTTPTGYKSTSSSGYKSNTPSPVAYRTSSVSPGPANLSDFTDSIQVIATYDFEGQEIDDLSFHRGDVIDVVKKTVNRDDWWIGKRGSKVGNFPANRTADI